jgi:hypothetical protein
MRRATVGDLFNLATSTSKTYMAFLAELDFHVNAMAARLISHHPVLVQQQLRAKPASRQLGSTSL